MQRSTSEEGDDAVATRTDSALAVGNAILLGTTTAYVVTDSALVAGIAAVAAAVPTSICLLRRHR